MMVDLLMYILGCFVYVKIEDKFVENCIYWFVNNEYFVFFIIK